MFQDHFDKHCIFYEYDYPYDKAVEQDRRSIKRFVKPMSGFKECHSAGVTLNGIDLVRM